MSRVLVFFAGDAPVRPPRRRDRRVDEGDGGNRDADDRPPRRRDRRVTFEQRVDDVGPRPEDADDNAVDVRTDEEDLDDDDEDDLEYLDTSSSLSRALRRLRRRVLRR